MDIFAVLMVRNLQGPKNDSEMIQIWWFCNVQHCDSTVYIDIYSRIGEPVNDGGGREEGGGAGSMLLPVVPDPVECDVRVGRHGIKSGKNIDMSLLRY
jgi:hypothetical protein